MKRVERGSTPKSASTSVREAARRYPESSTTVSTTLDEVIASPIGKPKLALRRPNDKDIERAAAADPDAPLLTPRQLAGGRTTMPEGKVAVSLRIDRAVVDAYKSTGRGWQTRMNEALAASIPEAPADTTETIRALERTVQTATMLIRKLKQANLTSPD